MSTFLDISAALDDRLNTMEAAPPIMWENYRTSREQGTIFLRPTLLPAEVSALTMSSAGTDEHIGIYQIDIFAPLNDGKYNTLVLADKIADWFAPGLALTYNTTTTSIVSVSRRASVRDATDSWFITPVEVRYQSFTVKR